MKTRCTLRILLALLLGLAVVTRIAAAPAREIVQPAGTLPVLHDVDVVVVGGASGGVAAAVEVAKAGAKVFLAAPRPYLGEDICATYRLWLEPGEQPSTDLAREIFRAAPSSAPAFGPSLPFQYSADRPPTRMHRDTTPPSLLSDGKWHGAPTQSVQYDGDVTLTLDLGREQEVHRVVLLAYQRPADFEVSRSVVSASADGKSWARIGEMTNDTPSQGFEGEALGLATTVKARMRHLQLRVLKTPESSRLLLGEIIIEGPGTAKPAPHPAGTALQPVKPMQVKRALDQALVQTGVPFLYGCFATELLRDTNGYPAGVVIANRSGRQAVLAKVIIDATDHATVARMANAVFTSSPDGARPFSRIVVGGAALTNEHLTLRQRPTPLVISDQAGNPHTVHEYELRLPLKDSSFAALANVEQLARDWTWTQQALDASETLLQVPADTLHAREAFSQKWPGAERIPLAVFRPAEIDQVFVLSGCAGVPRDAAAELMRPVNLLAVGARVGQAAADLAKRLPKPESVRLAATPPTEREPGEVHEVGAEANPRAGSRTVPAEAFGLPVLAEYDVVVVGGGTGGAPAGIAAGRQGAKTLLLEYLHGLGGVGTMGLISSYYHGNRVGFTKELDDSLAAFGPENTRTSSSGWNPEWKSEWYRRELRRAGVDIWYGTTGVGAVVERGRVTGVVVATPHGRGVILTKMVIDSTGNADIAAAAGAQCRYMEGDEVAVQGTGLPPRELGARYINTDYTFVDETDVFDIWRVLVTARQKFKGAYDLGQLVDTRERRQIVGDFTLSPMDMMLQRTFPDTVVIARSNFDTHGFTVHPMFTVRPPHREDIDVRVPYRCLLPRGLDGILVTGLGVSAHRDAIPVIRMQPDVQNQGYAAGVAAAMIAKRGCPTRELDLKELQRHLVEKRILPETVLIEIDSFPLPNAKVAEAVSRLTNNWEGLEVVLAQPETAAPLLREAFAAASSGDAKLAYAQVLGTLGDATGAEVLANAVASASWDKGWRYTGMSQFGASLSPLDSLIIALGRTRSSAALKPILQKVSQLNTNSEFSHFRAVAIALETLRDPAAAEPLATLIKQAGLSGHSTQDIQAALRNNPSSSTDNSTRNRALTELVLARALYRCGDYESLGEGILRSYAQDLHGHYARHAQAVLREARR